jgi:hypothetical protein
MSSIEVWNQLSAELIRLKDDDGFRLFSNMLGGLEAIVNVGKAGQVEMSADEVRNALDQIKSMQARVKAGANPREVFEAVMAGNLSKAKAEEGGATGQLIALGDLYNARGDLNQPQRDMYKAENIFLFNADKFFGDGYKDLKRGLEHLMVQVVLLVMTADEAQELASESVFARFGNSVYHQQFSLLQEHLTRAEIKDVLQRYGPTPEHWRPFSGSQETIAEVVTRALAQVRGFNKPLAPDFRNIRELAPETNEELSRVSLRLLREEGCMVVMDVVSMHHPAIQRAYRRSLLDVYSNVPVLRLTPIPSLHGLDDQEMLHFGDKYCDMEIFKRLNWDPDDSCRETDRAPGLLRWIIGNVPEMLQKRAYYKNAQANVQSSYKGSDGAA